MKIVVIGGTGLIGSKVVMKLREQGHAAVAAAPNTGVAGRGKGESSMTIQETRLETGTENPEPVALRQGEFWASQVPLGGALLVGDVAVFNIAGRLYATQASCTHLGGPLSQGTLDGATVTCPWHGTRFNVCTGAVLRGPAREPLRTYRVIVEGDVGRVERK